MAHPKQNLPRSLRQSATTAAPQARARSRTRTWAEFVAIGILLAVAIVLGISVLERGDSRAASEHRIDLEVARLLGGIPQHDSTLGRPDAPVTLEIFGDLKDPDSRSWFLENLPAIIGEYVRPGALKLEYHSYKTNTSSPQEFVKQQTAALAAGAQDRLWDFIDTFYHEQGSEFATYVTESYLDGIARQVPGLNIARWHADRLTGRREEQTAAEDQTASAYGLHVTPSFRIGLSGGAMHNYAGHSILKYGEQHPIALPEASDIGKAIKELERQRPR